MLEFYTDRFRTVDAVENALALQRMLGEDVPAGAHLAARRR